MGEQNEPGSLQRLWGETMDERLETWPGFEPYTSKSAAGHSNSFCCGDAPITTHRVDRFILGRQTGSCICNTHTRTRTHFTDDINRLVTSEKHLVFPDCLESSTPSLWHSTSALTSWPLDLAKFVTKVFWIKTKKDRVAENDWGTHNRNISSLLLIDI